MKSDIRTAEKGDKTVYLNMGVWDDEESDQIRPDSSSLRLVPYDGETKRGKQTRPSQPVRQACARPERGRRTSSRRERGRITGPRGLSRDGGLALVLLGSVT